jgi:hypothetical protein
MRYLVNARVGVVWLAVGAALSVWAIGRLAGVDFALKDRAAADNVGFGDVVIATLVAGFVAWGVYGLMARHGLGRWWPFVGSTVLAISVAGPAWLADGIDAVLLMAMHVVAGVILVAGLPRADGCAPGQAPGESRRDHLHRRDVEAR